MPQIRWASKAREMARNLGGWRTRRKIVVIESDDWGSIRMPSRAAYARLLRAGIRVDQCPYTRFDSLASEEDLECLFEVLEKNRDGNGRHPSITANAVVANPDFDGIRERHFQEYCYETLPDTFRRYRGCEKSLDLWKQGMSAHLFHPQFHGREHLNVARWMKALQQSLPETRMMFDMEMYGIGVNITSEDRRSYLAAYDYDSQQEIHAHKEIVRDGLRLFETLLGFAPLSFIAPNYIWHDQLEDVLVEGGVRYLQGAGNRQRPSDAGTLTLKRRRFGQRGPRGQIYLARNCFFEPSLDGAAQSVAKTLGEVSSAFLLGKPAVISSHRVNYIGTLVEANRRDNLGLLDNLLCQIVSRWPNVEFMTSDALGDCIAASNECKRRN